MVKIDNLSGAKGGKVCSQVLFDNFAEEVPLFFLPDHVKHCPKMTNEWNTQPCKCK